MGYAAYFFGTAKMTVLIIQKYFKWFSYPMLVQYFIDFLTSSR